MSYFAVNLVNALQLSMLIFLLAFGLTLIFGMMDYLSLAHGAFYTIGAYAGLLAVSSTGSFWLALLFGFMAPALVGALFQFFLLQPLVSRGQSTHLEIALFTLGFNFVVIGVAEHFFGPSFASIPVPSSLQHAVEIFGVTYPVYRLFIIGLGLGVAVVFWLILEGTVLGAVIRATVDDREMVLGMGIRSSLLFAAVFGAGCGMAGVAGVAAAPILSIYSHMGMEVLIITLIVVVVGGFGSILGSFIASLLIGLTNTIAQAYAPIVEPFAMYGVLALILTFKPAGVFGFRGKTG